MRFLASLVVSLLLHAALAVGIVLSLDTLAAPDELLTLDLSRVELSFAQEEAAVDTPVPVAPSPIVEEEKIDEKEEIEEEVEDQEEVEVEEEVEDVEEEKVEVEEPKVEERIEEEKVEEPPPKQELPKQEQELPTPPPLPPPSKPPESPKPKPQPPAPKPPPQPPTPAPIQGAIDAPPKPRQAIRPRYPQSSRMRGEEGDVVLSLHVTASGEVDRVEVVASSGFADLDEAAVKAAQKARFAPARSGSRRVDAHARLTLTFKLRK